MTYEKRREILLANGRHKEVPTPSRVGLVKEEWIVIIKGEAQTVRFWLGERGPGCGMWHEIAAKLHRAERREVEQITAIVGEYLKSGGAFFEALPR